MDGTLWFSISYLLLFSSFHVHFLLIVFLSDAALDQGAARLMEAFGSTSSQRDMVVLFFFISSKL